MYMRALISKGHLAQNLGRKVLFSTLLLFKSKTEIVEMSVTMRFIYQGNKKCKIDHHTCSDLMKLTFRALALRQSKADFEK